MFGEAFPTGFLGGWRFAVALVLSLLVVGAYGAGDARRDTGLVFRGTALAALLSLYQLAWVRELGGVAVQFVSVTVVVGSVLGASRWVVDRLVQAVRRVAPHRAILVMSERDAEEAGAAGAHPVRLLEARSEYSIVEVISGSGPALSVAALSAAIDRSRADTVLLYGAFPEREFEQVVDAALVNGTRLLAVPRLGSSRGIIPKPAWLEGRFFVELTRPALQGWQLAIKRALDIVGAIVAGAVLSPVMLLIALLIKLDSPGPIIFGQTRLGANGRRFRCYKFRSMRVDAEAQLRADPELYRRYVANHYKLPDESDPRITRVGRWLRRTSLDELPQLFNVLRGDMSLVGPRPIVPSELQQYGEGAALFLSLRPGITGAWAVNGRSTVGYPERTELELSYIRGWSVVRDLAILLRTLPAVLLGRGAH